MTSCITAPGPQTDQSLQYQFTGTTLQPGIVSWSPDSSQLAAIRNDRLTIIDLKSGIDRVVTDIHPSFIDWSPGTEIIASHEENGTNLITLIDPTTGNQQTRPVPKKLSAARWFNPPDQLITYSTEVKTLSIGTFVSYNLDLMEGENIDNFFQWNSYFPITEMDFNQTNGWIFPGLRPGHGSILAPQYHHPPNVDSFTQFNTIDPINSKEKEILRLTDKRFNIPASWSPDGSKITLTDDYDNLMIVDIDKPHNRRSLNHELRGIFPSWNPKKNEIYIGGNIVNSEGKAVKTLLANGYNSLGIWSPDGNTLAVICKGTLYIFALNQ